MLYKYIGKTNSVHGPKRGFIYEIKFDAVSQFYINIGVCHNGRVYTYRSYRSMSEFLKNWQKENNE